MVFTGLKAFLAFDCFALGEILIDEYVFDFHLFDSHWEAWNLNMKLNIQSHRLTASLAWLQEHG